jgi:hypothetical protein
MAWAILVLPTPGGLMNKASVLARMTVRQFLDQARQLFVGTTSRYAQGKRDQAVHAIQFLLRGMT